MKTAISEGVKISVTPIFRKDLSNVEDRRYLFNYHIEIVNTNPFPVQLKTRYWYIFDSLDYNREVSGPGVIGEQPILFPGEVFEYSSGCDLISEVGFMKGHYNFVQLNEYNKPIKNLRVNVPKFDLIAPFKLN